MEICEVLSVPFTRLTEPAGSYSPTMSRPILPGGWQVNTAMFLLLMIGTLALYWSDLRIGFFIIDDYGYVTDDPWIKGITLTNLRHILFTPHFANYSPVHLLSYLLDHTIAGLNPFAYHLSEHMGRRGCGMRFSGRTGANWAADDRGCRRCAVCSSSGARGSHCLDFQPQGYHRRSVHAAIVSCLPVLSP